MMGSIACFSRKNEDVCRSTCRLQDPLRRRCRLLPDATRCSGRKESHCRIRDRARSEMADAAIKSHTLNLLAYEVEHDEVIERNKAKNTDSDGFLLGALLEQWIFVDQ